MRRPPACGGRWRGAARVVRAVGGPSGVGGGGPWAAGPGSLRRATQTHGGRGWGAGQPPRCHRPPWNRKGWFHSPHRRSRRQSAGRLTGCSPPLGTGAWDSTTSNSMKGACRKRGGRLPTRPRARLPLPPRLPPPPGPALPGPPLHRAAGGAPCHQTTLRLGAVSTLGEEAVHDPRPHGPTLRGRGVMSQAQRVKDAGNASARGTCPGRGHGDPSSSLRFKTGCPQQGRREQGSAAGWAGPGGRPHGNRKLNCQPGW